MKTGKLYTLALGLAGLAALTPYRAAAVLEVSADINIQSPADFDQPLGASGTWIQLGTFRRCWHPAVTADWRPYCNGYWEWTDCGWYWVSDEPWAWACYHYGTWALDPEYGWVWIPGVEWAPAWVNWRVGGDYIGWAPCGPAGTTIETSAYVFVDGRHFHDHLRPDSLIVNNPTIISRTTEIRNSVTRENRSISGHKQTVVVNNGPGLATVEKVSGHKFSTVSVLKANQSTLHAIPEQVKRLRAESNPRPTSGFEAAKPEASPQSPKERERNVQPQTPTERTFRPTPDETPNNVPVPNDKRYPQTPPERTYRSSPNEVPHNALGPNERYSQQPPQERSLQPPPSERTIPAQNNELPGNRIPQYPKETLPPGPSPDKTVPVVPGNSKQLLPPSQPVKPAPVVPGNPAPGQKKPDQDRNPNGQ